MTTSDMHEVEPAVTATIANFVACTRFDDLPSKVVREARHSLLDFFACALAGARHPAVDSLVRTSWLFGNSSVATIVGRPERASPLQAALVNGAMAHVLDYDDTHMPSMLHPGSAVIPSLLAQAEPLKLPGNRLLVACAVGYETGIRLGNAVVPSHARRGWHTTGTVGTIAAAVAAASALGLSAGHVVAALGLAVTQAGGVIGVFGSMGKALNVGKAAMNGALAARLAADGFTAPENLIERDHGFLRVFSEGAQAESVTAALGLDWESLNTGRKPYPCGVVIHPAIDAALAVRDRLAGTLEFDRVDLCVNPYVMYLTGQSNPRTGLEGKFSVSHAVAAALVDGVAGPEQFTDARVTDPTIAAVRRRIRVTVDEALRTDEAVMTVAIDGAQIKHHVRHASGTRDNPLTDAQMTGKFRAAAEAALAPGEADRLLDAIFHVESLDAAELLALCVPGATVASSPSVVRPHTGAGPDTRAETSSS